MSAMSNLVRKLTSVIEVRPKKQPNTFGNHTTFIGHPLTFTQSKINKRLNRLARRHSFRLRKRNAE